MEIKQFCRNAAKFLANFSKPTPPPNHWIAYLAELKQLSRTAAKILDAYNHSHILAMQEIDPETNTEHLITWETRIQDIQVPRVSTTMDKDSNKGSVKHL